MTYEYFADLFNRWKASGLGLNAFLMCEGFVYSKCPSSFYRKLGRAFIKAVGMPEEIKRSIFEMDVKEADDDKRE